MVHLDPANTFGASIPITWDYRLSSTMDRTTSVGDEKIDWHAFVEAAEPVCSLQHTCQETLLDLVILLPRSHANSTSRFHTSGQSASDP